MNRKYNYVQHTDDEGIDQILVMVEEEPFLRCIMVPRYKTSGLSGDEWRVSSMWQRRETNSWVDLDGPYQNLGGAAAAIFCGVYVSHRVGTIWCVLL